MSDYENRKYLSTSEVNNNWDDGKVLSKKYLQTIQSLPAVMKFDKEIDKPPQLRLLNHQNRLNRNSASYSASYISLEPTENTEKAFLTQRFFEDTENTEDVFFINNNSFSVSSVSSLKNSVLKEKNSRFKRYVACTVARRITS